MGGRPNRAGGAIAERGKISGGIAWVRTGSLRGGRGRRPNPVGNPRERGKLLVFMGIPDVA